MGCASQEAVRGLSPCELQSGQHTQSSKASARAYIVLSPETPLSLHEATALPLTCCSAQYFSRSHILDRHQGRSLTACKSRAWREDHNVGACVLESGLLDTAETEQQGGTHLMQTPKQTMTLRVTAEASGGRGRQSMGWPMQQQLPGMQHHACTGHCWTCSTSRLSLP